MDGKDVVRIIDAELSKRGMTQLEFCNSIGVRSSSYSAWRKGSMPKPERLKQIEEYLGISFSESEKEDALDNLRDDLRILLRSAKDLPPSSVYQLIAQVEREKEKGVLPD